MIDCLTESICLGSRLLDNDRGGLNDTRGNMYWRYRDMKHIVAHKSIFCFHFKNSYLVARHTSHGSTPYSPTAASPSEAFCAPKPKNSLCSEVTYIRHDHK